MFGLKAQDIALVVGVLQRYPDVEEAIVYGSRAMGNYKPGSDVDIVLKGALTFDVVGEISAALNEHLPLPYKFDVVGYSMLTYQPLIEHIEQYGKSLYKKRS